MLRSVLDRFLPSSRRTSDILEIGCGNGGNLKLLSSYGRLCAVELDDTSRQRASNRGLARVEEGWLPDHLPFDRLRFDLIAALDILEHIEDESGALLALRNRLKPDGLILITVPAYQGLWTRHDELSHHRRRYDLRRLSSMLKECGFDPFYATYFNTLLFPLEALYLKFAASSEKDPYRGLRMPAAPLNALLTGIFFMESLLLPRIRLPFGLSVLALARTRDSRTFSK